MLDNKGVLEVEVDGQGLVVAVFYRCKALPFTQTKVEDSRARDMRNFYADHTFGRFKLDIAELPKAITGD